MASSSLRSVSYAAMRSAAPEAIEAAREAFCGRSSLGALAIHSVPNFADQRRELFRRGAHLALDPNAEQERTGCRADARIGPGWSGKPGEETHPIQSGFYADLLAEGGSEKAAGGSEVWGPNRWPPQKEGVRLRGAVVNAATTMHHVVLGTLDLAQKALELEVMAQHARCGGEDHVERNGEERLEMRLRQLAEESTFLPSRLVYYDAAFSREDKILGGQYWLPWHVDFNLATAFAPGLWVDEGEALRGNLKDAFVGEDGGDSTGASQRRPELDAGLLLRNAAGDVVPASLGNDTILVQLGAHTQIASGGHLRAGPHAVGRGTGDAGKGRFGRFSFGLFVYGPWEARMGPPEGYTEELVLKDDFGGLMANAYTGETVRDGFNKFADYMNGI